MTMQTATLSGMGFARPTGLIASLLGRLVERTRHAAMIAHLEGLDDRLLSDMGLDRDTIARLK